MAGERAERPERATPDGVLASPLLWKLALAGAALIWGFSFSVMKDVVETVPTFQLLAIRFLGATLITFVVCHRRVAAHLDAKTVGAGLAMGVFEWAAYSLQTFGIAETTAGKSAFLTGVYCVLVPFISYFMCGEKLTRYNVGAAALCLAGVGFVALDNLTISQGDLFSLGSAVFYALQLAMAAKYGRTQNVNAMTFWMLATMGVLSVAGCAVTEDPLGPTAFTPQLVVSLVFLSVICTCLLTFVMNIGLTRVSASAGSLLLSLESPSGVLFSVLLTGETLSARLLVGFALIFCSIVLSETHFDFLRGLLPTRREEG